MMEPGQTYWGHALAEDSDEWAGAFSTREAAIADGRSTYKRGEARQPFWIASGPAYSPQIDAADVIESLEDVANDFAPWSDEPILVVGKDAIARLRALLDTWVDAHVETQTWRKDGDAERIDAEAPS